MVVFELAPRGLTTVIVLRLTVTVTLIVDVSLNINININITAVIIVFGFGVVTLTIVLVLVFVVSQFDAIKGLQMRGGKGFSWRLYGECWDGETKTTSCYCEMSKMEEKKTPVKSSFKSNVSRQALSFNILVAALSN
jgi:hypothetical protein